MWRLVPSSWVHGSGGHSHMPLELIMGVDIALDHSCSPRAQQCPLECNCSSRLLLNKGLAGVTGDTSWSCVGSILPPESREKGCNGGSYPSLCTPPKQYTLSSVQSLSRVRLFATPWIAARQASLSITNSRSSFKLKSIKLVMPSSHLIPCHALLLLPSIPPSIRVFSNESTLRMRWPKYWSFNFSISPSNEHPGLISFRMDWLDLLAVQGTLKSLDCTYGDLFLGFLLCFTPRIWTLLPQQQ